MLVAMLATPIAAAKPWEPKNNDKFESYAVSLIPNFGAIAGATIEYIPNEANPNKIIATWAEEPMTSYIITVDGVPYVLGVDFEYTGVAVKTAIGAPFTTAPTGMPVGDNVNHFRVEYMFDFGDGNGGIDGTLKMLAETTNGPMYIRSLQGTGDLQNVQIWATATGLTHAGLVSGWPDIPPT